MSSWFSSCSCISTLRLLSLMWWSNELIAPTRIRHSAYLIKTFGPSHLTHLDKVFIEKHFLVVHEYQPALVTLLWRLCRSVLQQLIVCSGRPVLILISAKLPQCSRLLVSQSREFCLDLRVVDDGGAARIRWFKVVARVQLASCILSKLEHFDLSWMRRECTRYHLAAAFIS